MPPFILALPASRGIGFAAARMLLQRTALPIVATARSNLERTREALLEGLEGEVDGGGGYGERLHVLRVDVTDESTIAAAAAYCATHFPPSRSPSPSPSQQVPSSSSSSSSNHLHLAVISPGVLLPSPPERAAAHISASAARDSFAVNAIGPLLVFKHFSAFLPRRSTCSPLLMPSSSPPDQAAAGLHHHHHHHHHRSSSSSSSDKGISPLPPFATFLAFSARLGSISDDRSGGWYAYRASKAALNALVRAWDVSLQLSAGDKAVALAYHPGTVRTGFTTAFWDRYRRRRRSSGDDAFREGDAAVREVDGIGDDHGGGGRERNEGVDGGGGDGVQKKVMFEPREAAAYLLDLIARLRLEQRGRCWDWRGEEVPP